MKKQRKQKWCGWYYKIEADDFEKTGNEVSFIANGRWSFDKNLESIGAWTTNIEKTEVLNAYNDLCSEMNKNVDDDGVSDAVINISFTEDECGNLLLRTANGKISCYNGELYGECITETDYEYTKENLVRLNVYEEDEDIYWIDNE